MQKLLTRNLPLFIEKIRRRLADIGTGEGIAPQDLPRVF
jgi:hypothetical protein